jgi:hypothetical protein
MTPEQAHDRAVWQPDSNRVAKKGVPAAGERFGRLTVLDAMRRRGGKHCVLVECACGSQKLVRLEHLLTRQVRSCGCLRDEMLQEFARKRAQGIW